MEIINSIDWNNLIMMYNFFLNVIINFLHVFQNNKKFIHLFNKSNNWKALIEMPPPLNYYLIFIVKEILSLKQTELIFIDKVFHPCNLLISIINFLHPKIISSFQMISLGIPLSLRSNFSFLFNIKRIDKINLSWIFF